MKTPKYKSEYQRLRKNIIRRTKSLLSKGYYIPESDLEKIMPKPYSKLSSPPTKANIERLKRIQAVDIPKKFKYLDVDYDTGEVKEQSYKYGISKHISESKYGVISDEKYNKLLAQANAEKPKRKTAKRYTPFTDEYFSGSDDVPKYDFSENEPKANKQTSSPTYSDDDDDLDYGFSYNDGDENIVERIERRLEELTTFVSFSRFRKRRQSQEDYVRDTANRIYTAFIEAKDKNYNELAKKLSADPMYVNRLLEKISAMYNGDEDTEEQITEFLDYIKPKTSIDEAKSYDTGYDSYDNMMDEMANRMDLDMANRMDEEY